MKVCPFGPGALSIYKNTSEGRSQAKYGDQLSNNAAPAAVVKWDMAVTTNA